MEGTHLKKLYQINLLKELSKRNLVSFSFSNSAENSFHYGNFKRELLSSVKFLAHSL